MFFEYRWYECAPGRLAEEIDRMEEVAIAGWKGGEESVFDKYGIPRPIGAWSSVAGRRKPVFGYILQWDSFAQRDTAFPAFWAGPEWAEVRDRTNAGFTLVDHFDNWVIGPNAAWDRSGGCEGEPIGGLHEMRIHHCMAGDGHHVTAYLAEIEHRQMEVMGGRVIGVFDVKIGPDIPAIVSFIGWPDYETQQAAARRLELEPRVRERRRQWREELGDSPIRHVEQTLLKPLDYGKPLPNFGLSAEGAAA